MISRLSTFAAVFALVATGALALTVHARQQVAMPALAPVATTVESVRIIELPRVVVVGHRSERTTR